MFHVSTHSLHDSKKFNELFNRNSNQIDCPNNPNVQMLFKIKVILEFILYHQEEYANYNVDQI